MKISRRKSDPQDVGLAILLDDFGSCGQEHPRLAGNECALLMDHIPETHMDLDGNQWTGSQPDA